jgi:hypothetical protein
MIKATPKEVYEALADITNMGNFSPVCKECYFETDNHGVGGWFVGKNVTPERSWETRSQITVANPGKEFTFIVNGDRVQWGYKIEPFGEMTQLTEEWIVLEAWQRLYEERFGSNSDIKSALQDRLETAQAGIRDTLQAIKAYLEK